LVSTVLGHSTIRHHADTYADVLQEFVYDDAADRITRLIPRVDVPRISAFYTACHHMYGRRRGNTMRPTFTRPVWGDMRRRSGSTAWCCSAVSLPVRALGHVMEWAALHEQSCRDNWQRVTERTCAGAIEPLA